MVDKLKVAKDKFSWYTNHLNLSITRMGSTGYLEYCLILDHTVATEELGYVDIQYQYLTPDGIKQEKYWHSIWRNDEAPRVLRVDVNEKSKDKHDGYIIMAPEKPIIFKGDGTVEIKDTDIQ